MTRNALILGRVARVTPAVEFLTKKGIPFALHEYPLDGQAVEDQERSSESSSPRNSQETSSSPKSRGHGLGVTVAQLLGIPALQMFKTLIVEPQPSLPGKKFLVALVPADHQLAPKQLAQAAGAKRVQLANTTDAERLTGYLTGGISPFGQKRTSPTYLDSRATQFDHIYVSAGQRGLSLSLSPNHLLQALAAQLVEGLAAE